MYRKYIVPAIGVASFIIGGIIVREKTLEGIDTVEEFFDKNFKKHPEHEVVQGEVIDNNK